MTNSRYIGSDDGLQRIARAGQSVVKTTLDASAAAAQATQDYLNVNIRNNQQLFELEQQKAIAKGRTSNQPTGFETLADAGVKYLLGNRKLELEQEEERQKQMQLANEQAAKTSAAYQKQQQTEREEENALTAESEISDSYRVLLGREGNGTVEQFKQQAIEILSRYPTSVDNQRKIMNQINTYAESRSKEIQTRLGQETDKLNQQLGEQATTRLQLELNQDFGNLKAKGVSEQSRPILDGIEQKIKAFLGADNNLSETQKLTAVNSVLKRVQEYHAINAEEYAKYNSNIRNFSVYAQEAAKAKLEFESGKDKGNLDAYYAKIAYAKNKYGDWGSSVSKLGEAEQRQLETAKTVEEFNSIRERAAKSGGSQFKFSGSFSQWVAANAINDPYYESRILGTPLADNPQIKTGLTLAKRYREYEEERAKLQVDQSRLGVDFARLNLTRANEFAAVVQKLAEANASGQMTPQDQALQQELQSAAQGNPVLAALLADKLQNPKKQIDAAALQKQLDLVNPAISGIQQALTEQSKQMQAQLRAKYSDLEQAGLFVERKFINEITTKSKDSYQKELDAAQQDINSRVQQTQAFPTGVQPNFNSSSVYAPDVDDKGRVRVAPRTALQTVKMAGVDIITPVIKGANAPPSFNTGMGGGGFGAGRNGGRRKHAGVDFGLDGNERAAALVGGTAHVFNASGYGGVVDIIGDNGYVYRYTHQGALVKTGQRIKAGEAISQANGSGVNIGGNHLHFEVRKLTADNFDSNGRYKPTYGFDGNVLNPIEHLQQLSVGQSNVLQPRNSHYTRKLQTAYPHMKVPPNALVTGNGGALQANVYQQVNGQSINSSLAYNNQRPLKMTGVLPKNAGNPTYNYADDFGYAYLRQNSDVRRALIDTAKRLKVPAHWIADIIAQESNFNAKSTHSGRNYGFFGFGHDSFSDVSASQLRSASPVQQIKLYEKYMLENGWERITSRRGSNVTIGELWSISRMGVKLRNKLIANPDNTDAIYMNDYGHSYTTELKRLGRGAGRSYEVQGVSNRRKRNAAVSTQQVGYCPICQQMEVAQAFVPHQHDLS